MSVIDVIKDFSNKRPDGIYLLSKCLLYANGVSNVLAWDRVRIFIKFLLNFIVFIAGFWLVFGVYYLCEVTRTMLGLKLSAMGQVLYQ